MKVFVLLGSIVCLGLSSCGGGGSGDTPTRAASEDAGELARADIRQVDELYPYANNSAYSDVLASCALADTKEQACTLNRLPFIGQANASISVDDVMSRVLVTHDWMGERFETLLRSAPEEMIELFAPVTVISIGSTVRPSFYSTRTAAIRLDPARLWLTVEEKANISIAEDYRSDFGLELNFWEMRSARIDGKRAFPSSSLTSFQERSFDDMKLRAYSLLFHELGHAVDYINPQYLSLVDQSLNPFDAISALREYRGSLALMNVSPLNSIDMDYLALVQFRGYIATEEQKRFTPSDVGGFMSSEGAATYYGYHTEREDFATLFEYAMMKKHFNVDLYTGFVSKPLDDSDYGCSELIVGWGQRNRLSDVYVWPRSKWVVERVFGPSAADAAFFDSLIDEQSQMNAGIDWCTNRDNPNTTIASRSSQKVISSEDQRAQLEYERRQRLH